MLTFTGKERDQESGLDYFGARYYGSGVLWDGLRVRMRPLPIKMFSTHRVGISEL
jgi:hypothetical protein